ncbi:TolC family protein [Asticcacaulis sp. 201]|uniref:TolC family protein n=1 Tax=Asticcacaulis sp. 201 TaxID=3028787 RepID=UPI002915D4FF|nr:TolC family protein [Asticcacaulis sp. 201]MDV6330761.1 TolC family protein [Asticcacaulis sp. 201]
MRRLALGLLSLMLAGCASAPVYRRADEAAINRPTASTAFINGENPAFAAHAVPGEWWKLYDDARLNGLIQDALKANTDLRAASTHIARARIGLDVAKDDAGVKTELSAGLEYGQPAAQEYLLLGEHLPSDFLYTASAGVSYQVDLAGQVKSAIDAARSDVSAAQATYDAVQISVVADTTRAWLDACATGHQIDIAHQALALQQESSELARRLVAAGRGGASDVTRSSGQEAQVRAALPVLLAAHQAALYRLAALTGRTPAELPTDIGTCNTLPHLSQPIPVGDGAALLQRRPDVRAREAELRAATSRAGVANAALYPHIALGASVGSVGLASDFLRYDTMKYGLGPLISWEFPNRKRAKAAVATAQTYIDETSARFDGTVLGALRETETALNTYARDLDQRAELQAAHDHAVESLSETQRLQKAGRVSVVPVLDARRAVVQADQTLAGADARLAADQVQLFLALGGGWQH